MKPRKLPDLDPITREEIAQWIEQHGEAQAARIPDARLELRKNPDAPGMRGSIQYWDACLSWSKRLAYMVRTAKSKRGRSALEPQAEQRRGTPKP